MQKILTKILPKKKREYVGCKSMVSAAATERLDTDETTAGPSTLRSALPSPPPTLFELVCLINTDI